MPLPPSAGGAVPLPGAPSYQDNPFEASTAVNVPAAEPVDFGFDSSPAEAPPAPSYDDAPAGGFDFGGPTEDSPAVPLPGSANPSGDVPMADADSFDFASPGAAVPLPGHDDPGSTQGFDAFPPQDAEPQAEDAGVFDINAMPGAAVPLPGSPAEAISLPPPPEEDFSVDSSPPAHAVPLPGSPDAFSLDDLPPGPTAQAPAAAPSFDFDMPAPAGAAAPQAIDFGDLPSPAGEAPPSDSFSFDDLPAPPAATPAPDFSLVDGGDLPAPAAKAAPAPNFDFDIGELPPPPAPAAPSVTPAPQSAAPDLGMDFGGVDFGDPAPQPAASKPAPAASASDDGLEFDPTSAPPSGGGGGVGDELEADLSAPLPPAADKPADGLEMLSFIDDAAKEAKVQGGRAKAKRFHVRRRSGKVFGPFDEGVVVKMLEDGQLLGNEDVSTDNESWAAIGTIPSFGVAIQKLMDAPAVAAGAATAGENKDSAASMEKLKNLYEGRMAAVAVVDRSGERARFKKRLPFYIAAGVLLVLVAGGASLGFTPYGVFALKKIMPARISAGTPQAAQFDNAKKALIADTYKSYLEARDSCDKLLQIKEYPEVRAVWIQSVFYLSRRYATSEAQVPKAKEAIQDISLLGPNNAEVVKALSGQKLAEKDPAGALQLLQAAAPRQENANDVELQFLIAEAYAQQGNQKLATQTLEGILAKRADSAKALHALGNLHQAAGEADDAAKNYEAALKADPNHVVSAVELAAVELLVRKDQEKGKEAVDRALDEKTRSLLGPAEIARAYALQGVLFSMGFKQKEALAAFDEALKNDKDSVFVQANMARVLLDQRDYDRAMPLFKAASEKQPKNLEYTEGYLSSLVALGKMNDALTALNAANAQFPGNPKLAYLSARVNDALDNTVQAESDYKRAINGDPKLYEANLYLARFYLRFRRFQDAKPQIEQANQKAPQDAKVQTGVGELAVSEGRVDDAKVAFEKSVQLDPNLPDPYLGLARVAYERGDYKGALAQVDRALELDKKLPGARLQRGLVDWKLGQLDGALQELEIAKAADPRSAQIPMVIGAVKLDKGDLAGAEAAVSASLSTDPSNPEAYYYLARVKNKRAEHTQAIDAMKNALDRSPNRPDFHLWMGRIYRDAKKPAEAIEEFNSVVKLDANNADALEALGTAYLDRSEFDTAVGFFKKALSADPQRTAILGHIGDCYFQNQKWDEAIATYNQALQADSSLNWVYFKIGRSYTEQNKHPQAIGWYQKAAKFDAENPMPYWYLGFAYKEKGAKKDAIDAFKNYLAKKPEAEDKKMIEDEIYDLEH
ncbi:MAG: tetratricopeptide repeat protein [Myxococcaceae bacterium]